MSSAATWLVVFLGLIIHTPRAEAQQARPVYVLSIGSSRYLAPQLESDHAFAPLPGAANGAMAIAERLADAGARRVIALTSHNDTVVGLSDIRTALGEILAQVTEARHSSATDPILVVYIASHGISEGFGWNHFSIPGDFTYRGDARDLQATDLAEQALHAASIVDQLDKSGVDYVLILDSCHEGEEARIDSPVLSRTAQENIGDIAAALRTLNEFRQESPVIFSTEPGTTVPTAPDPDDPMANSMGPMGRRLVLALDRADERGQPLTVRDAFRALTDKDSDELTNPGVSHAQEGKWWGAVVASFDGPAGTVERRGGSATTPRLCCEVIAQRTTALPAIGRITIKGEPGEFLTAGRSYAIDHGITVDALSETDVEIGIEDPEGDWSLQFSSGSGLREGLFRNAMRAGFEEHGRPGMSITGHHAGCNEVSGSFDVLSWPRNGSGALKIRFRHLCDDTVPALEGDIDVIIANHGESAIDSR